MYGVPLSSSALHRHNVAPPELSQSHIVRIHSYDDDEPQLLFDENPTYEPTEWGRELMGIQQTNAADDKQSTTEKVKKSIESKDIGTNTDDIEIIELGQRSESIPSADSITLISSDLISSTNPLPMISSSDALNQSTPSIIDSTHPSIHAYNSSATPSIQLHWFIRYVYKLSGAHAHPSTPLPSTRQHYLMSFFASFIGIAILGIFHFSLFSASEGLYATDSAVFLIASFGASAVLLYTIPHSDFSQPRNVFGGHLVSALVGVIIAKIIPPSIHLQWFRAALSVSLAIVAQNITKTVHPPGGATALVAVLPNAVIEKQGWLFIVLPIGVGASIMTVVAVVMNNCIHDRHYPRFWF